MKPLLYVVVLLIGSSVRAGDTKPQAAAERGLKFLLADADAWKKERQCATCHHGTFTVWALAPEALTEAVTWTKERFFKDLDKPRDTRPGYSMVNSSALMLGLMATAVDQKEISADDLKRITGHLLRHQEVDGSWSWASAPAANRPPPFFESDEVATRIGILALGSAKDSKEGVEKAAAWLAKAKPADTSQAAAYRLLIAARTKKDFAPELEAVLKRQNKDGGWGQVPNAASDAYATGQILYLMNVAGVKRDREEVRRGVAFLVGNQKADGSWPMMRRGHQGVTPGEFKQPIIYFGSAWATLALMRTNPR
jgi:hypothetical protein